VAHEYKLVGARTFEKISGWTFVEPEEVDDPVLEQLDLALVNLPQNFLAPLPDLRNRAVMIVGNGEISNYGRLIDQSDFIIRINSMYRWRADAEHDGMRVNAWAGLPAFAVEPLKATATQWTNSNFGRIAPSLEMIWGVSPYQCSVRAYRWLRDEGLLPKFFSISDPFTLLDEHFDRLQPHFAAKLFSMPILFNGATGITNFELLLTGVKIVLLVYLSGAQEIHICGFNLFKSEEEKMWAGHDWEANIDVIRFVRDACRREGRSFFWREQLLVDPE
jgi:hypothetical protein